MLKQLKHLKTLYANNINIQNIGLSNNPKLKKLSVEFNVINDVKFLEENQDLKILVLTGNKLLEDIYPLKNLSKHNELYLQDKYCSINFWVEFRAD